MIAPPSPTHQSSLETIDTLIIPRWIIPIEPADSVLQDHAIAIKGGRIVAVLPTEQAVGRLAATEIVERPDHVVLPGLVNAHTHVGMTLLRGAAENLSFDAWLKDRIWPLEARLLDPEFVRDGTELAIAGMIASGTTCFAEQYFFPDVVAQTASALGMRACLGAPIVHFRTPWAVSGDECLDKAIRLHDVYRDDPLITTAFAPHSVYSVPTQLLARLRTAADEIESPVMMHLHESPGEVTGAERPLAILERLGMLTPLFSGVHMTQLIGTDIDCIVGRGINVIHCPQSNLKLDNGVCPAAELVGRGVNVALGTDGAASNNDLDMLDELRTAALLAGSKLSAHSWLRIATINGARALNLSDSIGSIVPGKWADLTCVNLRDVNIAPIYDPASALVYAANRANVSDVWIAGRTRMRAHKLEFDSETPLARAEAWRQRILRT